MSFQPVVPFSGMAGWSFLKRTQESQQEALSATPEIKRDTQYFLENIGKISTAEELVEDHRLLKVALGAFGLEEDIGNKFFIRKVLEDGTSDPQALGNKLADKRYLEFSRYFGFGESSGVGPDLASLADEIVTSYETRTFEILVGEQDPDLRLSLGLERDLEKVLAKDTTPDGMWYSVMGTPPLRKVFEMALGLPESFGTLDIDDQLAVFRKKTEEAFGNGEVSQFKDPEKLEELNRLFLARSQIANLGGGMSSMNIALTLLQSA